MKVLGIDIGGSGIKGAPVDVERGVLLTERYRIPTPQPSKPKAVARTVAKIAAHFDWQGPIGCTFPAVGQRGGFHFGLNETGTALDRVVKYEGVELQAGRDVELRAVALGMERRLPRAPGR